MSGSYMAFEATFLRTIIAAGSTATLTLAEIVLAARVASFVPQCEWRCNVSLAQAS